MKNKPTEVVQGGKNWPRSQELKIEGSVEQLLKQLPPLPLKLAVILSDQCVVSKYSPHAFLGKMFSVSPTGLWQSN